MIPLSIPNLKGNEKKYLMDCIDTNFVSSVGPYVTKFEDEFAKYHGQKHAVAVVNGTAALHISLILSGVEAGDHVFIPSLCFIAAANSIKYMSAKPVLIDSEWSTLSLCPISLEAFLRENYSVKNGNCVHNKSGEVAKAIILVHTFGNMANTEELLRIASEFKLKVIEDACEALGSERGGEKAGTIGDFGCFSFNGNKIITSGAGGMILAKSEIDAQMAKHLTTTAKVDSLHFEHDKVGYNYRMVNVLAALGLAQFEILEEFLKIKKSNYERYCLALSGVKGLKIHASTNGQNPNYWFYSLIVEDDFPLSRDELMGKLIDLSIGVRPVWTLIEDQLPYLNSLKSETKISRDIQSRIISLPCSTNLTESEIEEICEKLKSFKK